MQKIYLVCGVPGSGKSWVCEQLKKEYYYIPHDDYSKENYHIILFESARSSEKPVLADCPFAERELRERLIEKGCHVVPVFIVESPQVCKARYEYRGNGPYPKNFLTRASSIGARALEWHAFRGTSTQVLIHLKELLDE